MTQSIIHYICIFSLLDRKKHFFPFGFFVLDQIFRPKKRDPLNLLLYSCTVEPIVILISIFKSSRSHLFFFSCDLIENELLTWLLHCSALRESVCRISVQNCLLVLPGHSRNYKFYIFLLWKHVLQLVGKNSHHANCEFKFCMNCGGKSRHSFENWQIGYNYYVRN